MIPFREIARVAVKHYPTRAVLGLALFIGQAFIYNAVTFDLGTILNEFFDVAPARYRPFMILFARATSSGRCCSGGCSTPSGASR